MAVQRAKDAESQGRFEDALQAYELAATLDPSDIAIKRHIALLRARISRENDLIR
jgi:cytochrome c-type biogenesis protein CcmH/NrfG